MGEKIRQLRTGRGCTGRGFGPDLETAGSAQSVALRIDALIGSRDPRVAQKFTHEAAVFQNSPTGYILNHRFWTRVSEHIFDQLTKNCLQCFKYERL